MSQENLKKTGVFLLWRRSQEGEVLGAMKIPYMPSISFSHLKESVVVAHTYHANTWDDGNEGVVDSTKPSALAVSMPTNLYGTTCLTESSGMRLMALLTVLDIETILAEAELLRIATEVFDKFDFIPQYFIQINHKHLNDALFDIVGITDPNLRYNINEVISLLQRDPWSIVLMRLEKEVGLTSDIIDDLRKCFQLKGPPKQVIKSLSTLFCKTKFKDITAYYNAQSTLNYLSRYVLLVYLLIMKDSYKPSNK